MTFRSDALRFSLGPEPGVLRFTLGPELMTAQGKPHGWMRAVPAKIGRFARMLTPKRERAYQAAVKAIALKAAREQGFRVEPGEPVAFYVSSYLRRPKRIKDRTSPMWAPVKPDADNIAKSIMDALEPDVVPDDKQVVCLRAMKLYATDDESPRVEVVVVRSPEMN